MSKPYIDMFKIFKKKSKLEKLQKNYAKLMEEGYKLSTIKRAASDEKYAQAHQIMLEIENLQAKSTPGE